MRQTFATLRQTLDTLRIADRRLTAFGLLMLAVLAACGVGLAIDPRVIGGASAWLKPAKFAASIAIYSLTLAAIFTFLPDWTRVRRTVSTVTVVAFAIEIGTISLQAWRGTTSHFNVATPVDRAVFAAMGIAIVIQTAASVAVAVALWRQRFADRALGWALRSGMIITIVGAASGGLMTRPTPAQLTDVRATHRISTVGAHTVGAPDGGPGLPGTGWSRSHGDLRVPHFIGMHAVQALPIFAVLLRRRRLPDAARVRLALVAAAGFLAVFVLLLTQALRGEAVLEPSPITWSMWAAWLAVTVGAGWLASARSLAGVPRSAVVAG